MVQSEIIEEVKNSEVFSIMADETKDVSKSEQISFTLRYYYNVNKNNLIGQAYDGAAVMSCKHSGVQARIKEQAKFAFYIHCSAHCLNLVLVDVVKNVPETGVFLFVTEPLYFYLWLICAPKMPVSPKRNVWQNKRAATFKRHTLGMPISSPT